VPVDRLSGAHVFITGFSPDIHTRPALPGSRRAGSAAKAIYGSVFGWVTQDMPMAGSATPPSVRLAAVRTAAWADHAAKPGDGGRGPRSGPDGVARGPGWGAVPRHNERRRLTADIGARPGYQHRAGADPPAPQPRCQTAIYAPRGGGRHAVPRRRASLDRTYPRTRAVITAGPPQFQQNTIPGDTSRSLPWMSHAPQVYAAKMVSLSVISSSLGTCEWHGE
jgi:hypothetical protein